MGIHSRLSVCEGQEFANVLFCGQIPSNDGLLPWRAARNQGRGPVGDDFTVQAPEQIATAAEFTRELQALRARSGLTIRAIARAAKTPVATTGDYFSGRHLPLDRDRKSTR